MSVHKIAGFTSKECYLEEHDPEIGYYKGNDIWKTSITTGNTKTPFPLYLIIRFPSYLYLGYLALVQ